METERERENKYNNEEVVIDNIKFQSTVEGWRYFDLKILLRAGEISHLECQPKFEIAGGIRWNGKKLQGRSYIADFLYWDISKERWIVEDVKGVRTQLYTLKRLLFLTIYGDDYEFIES